MIAALIWLVIYIIVVGLIIAIILFVLDRVPIEESFKRVARMIVYAVALIIVLLLALQLLGAIGPMPRLNP